MVPMSNETRSVRALLRGLMDEHGIRYAEVAGRLGWPVSTVTQQLNGNRNPTEPLAAEIQRMAGAWPVYEYRMRMAGGEPPQMGIRDAMIRALAEVGDVPRALGRILADGRIVPAEVAELAKEVGEGAHWLWIVVALANQAPQQTMGVA